MVKATENNETIEFEFEHTLPLAQLVNGSLEVKHVRVTISGDARQYRGPGGQPLYHGEITHIFFAAKGHDDVNVLELVQAVTLLTTGGAHKIPNEVQVRANVHAECALLEQSIRLCQQMRVPAVRALVTPTEFGMLIEPPTATPRPGTRAATLAETILIMNSVHPPYAENLSWKFLVDAAKAEAGQKEIAA